MKKLYTLLLALSVTTVVSQATTKTVKHAIKSGETLYTIAHQNHTTIEEVRKVNGLKKGEMLKLGRVLNVPKNTYFPKKQSNFQKNEKKKITKLAKKKHVSKKKLSKKLKTTKDTSIYAVKKGDTLFTIAKKHKMTVAKLLKLNKIDYKATLKLGQNFKVDKSKKVLKKTKIVKIKKKFQKKKLVRKSIRNKKSNRALKMALSKNAKSIRQRRAKHKYIDDILFKTAKLDIMSFGSSKKGAKIISLAKKKLGRRYVWGATGKRNTFDCSGLTTYVYKKNGIALPRRAIAQSKVGKRVSRYNLKKGDLVFFDTSKRHKGYVNHVGIYIGNGKFIHASSAKKKVVITSLNKAFYSQRFKVARRFASSS